MTRFITVVVLAAACRTPPSPPPPANAPGAAPGTSTTAQAVPETEPQAVARCAREHPDCRWPFAVMVFPECLHPCGPGQHCESTCEVTPAPAGTWQCMCDHCGSNADCPPGLLCGVGPCELGRPARHCLLKPPSAPERPCAPIP